MDLSDILPEVLIFAVGLVMLIKCSDIFIEGAASTARKHGVSEHFIGLTLVAVATSLPELAVSVIAAFENNGALVLGNVVGSNVANIALVLGTAALVMVLEPDENSLKDANWMLLSVLLLGFFVYVDYFTGDGTTLMISRGEGFVFIVLYFLYIYKLYKNIDKLETPEIPEKVSKLEAIFIIGGAFGIFFGARFMVSSARNIAESFGISLVIIGLTIIAIGTSLPELAASLTAALKKKRSIAVGNVIGSNIFNIFLVLGSAALVRPIKIDNVDGSLTSFTNTFPVLLFSSIVLAVFLRKSIKKIHAVLFLMIYALFILLMTVKTPII